MSKKAYVGANFFGAFAVDERGKLVAWRHFPREAEAAAGKISEYRKGSEIEEMTELEKELGKKGYEIVRERENDFVKGIEKGYRKLAEESGFSSDPGEINMLIARVNVILSRESMSQEKRDRIITHVIGIIDELDTVTNNLSERVREWYGLYSPEDSKNIRSVEKFLEKVSLKPERSGTSSGMPFKEPDLKEVSSFSSVLSSLVSSRSSLSKYIEEVSRETVPNLNEVAGPLLAARLLSLAGGLERMSKMPSSKIQLLGAEKALFRHLKGQGKAPKYGVIFGHPLVQNASKPLKGKVARMVAAKISLASKMDMYSKRIGGKEMKAEMEKKASQMAAQFRPR